MKQFRIWYVGENALQHETYTGTDHLHCIEQFLQKRPGVYVEMCVPLPTFSKQ